MADSSLPLDADSFLAETAWLQGLARALVQEEQGAEDLLQDAWLATASRQRRTVIPPTGWLAGVLRNLARIRQRTESRLRRRQALAGAEAAARLDEALTPAQIVERAEILKLVVNSLMDLEEPYRSTLLLHFYQGLPPREIAHRTGVPAGTVRSHAHRGIEMLRRRLRRNLGEDWRATCLLLVASGTAQPLPPPPRPTSVSPVPTALAMNAKLKFAAGAVLATLLIWVAIGHREAQVEQGAREGVSAALVASEDGPRSEVLDDPATARLPISSPAEAPVDQPSDEPGGQLEVLGQILDTQGGPVPGACVVGSGPGTLVYADAEGRFRLPTTVPPSHNAPYVVTAWAEGRAPAYTQLLGPGPAFVVLPEPEPCMLQVVRATDGAPIAGAMARAFVITLADTSSPRFNQRRPVELPVRIPPSGTDGLIRLPAAGFYCCVSAPDYEPLTYHAYQPRTDPYQVRLQPKRDFRVRLVGADGTPWGGARCSFDPGDGEVEADEAGWVMVPALARATFESILIRRGNLGVVVAVNYLEHNGPLQGPLQPNQSLLLPHAPRHGRIDAPPSLPPESLEVATGARAWIYAVRHIPDPALQHRLLSWRQVASDGSFELTEGWQGAVTMIHVRRASDGRFLHSEELLGPGPYLVRLKERFPVSLRFHAEPASVLEDAHVALRGRANAIGPLRELCVPLEAGNVTLDLVPGRYTLEMRGLAFDDSGWQGELSMPSAPWTADFDLGRRRELRGVIRAAGRPVVPASVILKAPSFASTALVDANGEWIMRGVPSEELRLRVVPGDNWLTVGTNWIQTVPPDAEVFDVDLEVATLELRFRSGEAPLPHEVDAWRKELPEVGNGVIPAEGVRQLLFPASSGLPVRVVTTPCVVHWRSRDPYRALDPESVELHGGEVESVELSFVPMGGLGVWMRNHGGDYFQVKMDLECLERFSKEPGPERPRRINLREFPREAGHFDGHTYTLPPGRWRATLRGPIERNEPRTSKSKPYFGDVDSVWATELTIEAGQTTCLWVDCSAEESLHLETEILDPR